MLVLPMNNRKRLFTEDLEDGELPEVDVVGKFDDGYDENLMGDAADRNRLESLCELERERELYDRSVKREDQMFKWGIRSLLLEKEKSESISEVAVAVKERSNTRRLHLEAQRGTNKKRSALDRLVEQRNNKRGRYKARIIVNHITADEDEEEQQQQQELEQEQEIKSSSFKKLKLKTQDIYSDDSSISNDDEEYVESVKLIETLTELEKAVLTRNQLEEFLEKPIFEQTVIGCFVRVSIGAAQSEQPLIYRLSEIVALETIEQEYQLGSRRTKRVLQLKHGAYQRSFLMNVVSNQPVTSSEFSFFLDTCQRDALPLPSLKKITEKEKDIEKAANYAFTEGDVELIVQTKRQSGRKLMSAAYRKVCLIMERDMAVESNDLAKASELDLEIKEIDEQSLKEPPREKRIPFISSRVAQIPPPMPLPPIKSKFISKSNDYQQNICKRSTKIASIQEQQQQSIIQPSPVEKKSPTVSEPKSENIAEQVTSELEQLKLEMDKLDLYDKNKPDTEKLDLYELYNVPISLDLSNLLEFNAIFSETGANCLL